MTQFKYIPFIVLLFSFQLLIAQSKIKVDGIAAVVGKNVILESDVTKFKEEVILRSEGKAEITSCKMLDEIMMQKLLAHHAVVDSVVVTDTEVKDGVDRTIKYFVQQLGTVDKVVEMYGFNSEKDLRDELMKIERENTLMKKEQQNAIADVSITPQEVRAYFKSLKKEGNLPEFGTEIELAQIVLYAEPTDEAVAEAKAKLIKLKEEVVKGASFRMKAVLYSDDPAVVENGGQYVIKRESPFVKEFKEVAFSLDEGEISQPFKTMFGYHIIQVEKIRGQELDVRHILVQPKISDEKLSALQAKISRIRSDIISEKITFSEAVKKYSQEDATKQNHGILINPYTNDSYFELTKMDPTLYKRVNDLKEGEITQPYFDETREGSKMFKIITVKSRVEAHVAELAKDYIKIQKLALVKKKDEELNKWAIKKIKDTYISIGKIYNDCEFEKPWN